MLYFSRADSLGNLKSDKIPLRNSYPDLIQIQDKSCVYLSSFFLFVCLFAFLSLLQIFMQVMIIVIMKGTTEDEMVGWHY